MTPSTGIAIEDESFCAAQQSLNLMVSGMKLRLPFRLPLNISEALILREPHFAFKAKLSNNKDLIVDRNCPAVISFIF